MMKYLYFLALVISLGVSSGCDDNGNQGAARMTGGIKLIGLTPVDKKDFANRFIKAGWVAELQIQDTNGQDMGQNNVELEVEVINNFTHNSCQGNQFGTELPYYNWDPNMPCFDLWAFNHFGNKPPAEGWLNGQHDAPGTKRYFRTDNNGRIKLDIIWELAGNGFANHLCALDIIVIARVVRQSQPDPDVGERLRFNWSFDAVQLRDRHEPANPLPKFTPKPGRQAVVEDECHPGEPFTDTDGDGWPDWMDQCPNSDQGLAGPCGCDQPKADEDGDFWLTCPMLAVQPAGTDQYPQNPHCHEWPCGQSPDLDSDGDVDMDDFGLWQRTQPDLNLSDTVDDGDVELMRHCQSGAGVPWSNHCLP